MSFPSAHNIGAYIKALRAAANTSATAGGTGDNTAVTGLILDRTLYAYPLSAVLALSFSATLAAGKSLTLKNVLIEHGDDSALSDAATLFTLEDATGTKVATSAGGGTVTGCKEYDFDLAGAKRYLRVKFTPDLDATATDTAEVAALLVVGGADTLPL